MKYSIACVGMGLAAFLLICSPVMAQNLIENGSFETPVVVPDDWPGYLDGDAVPGWTRINDMGGLNNNVDDGDEPNPFMGAGRPIPDGDQVYFVQQNVDESEDMGVSLTQEIEGFQDGRYYTLSFYVGIRPNNDGMSLDVTLGDMELMEQTWFSNSSGPLELIELTFQYDSDAVGTPELSFNSINEEEPEGDNTILYDDVRLELISLGAKITGPSFAEVGDDITLSVDTSDAIGEVSIQWYFDGVEIEGETDATLELAALEYEDSGVYSVEVSDEVDNTSSAHTLAVVEALPVANILAVIAMCIVLLGAGVFAVRKLQV